LSAPAISVVVPTYRRPDLLRRCLDALADQDLPAGQFEVVVVDDGSGDETDAVLAEEIARGRLDLQTHTQARNAGPAAARNRAVASARADLVLFLDDDVAASPGLLATHLDLHGRAGDSLLAVLGRVDWHPSVQQTPFLRWLDRSDLQFGYETWLREGPVDPPYAAFYTANLSIRRALLQSVGGFDERFPYAAFEDMELGFRLAGCGLHLDYRPQALAFHTRSMSLPDFCGRMERVGESAELMRRAAPDLPLDDEQIRSAAVRRRERLRRRLAAWRGGEQALHRHYWAEVGAAYARGRARATR
jgi:glycosyltransferase involved in cell wall biosynthesis